MLAEEFMQRVGNIVGSNISDGKVNLRFSWNNFDEAKTLLAQIRSRQKELRLLKKEVSLAISGVKSEFVSERNNVGRSLGAGLAGAFLGRRSIGRINAIHKNELRTRQLSVVGPYENVKQLIDQILFKCDEVKAQIELSPEYRNKSNLGSTPNSSSLPLATKPSQYLIHVNGQVKGPYTKEQLIALRDNSIVNDDTQCSMEGSEEWHPFYYLIE